MVWLFKESSVCIWSADVSLDTSPTLNIISPFDTHIRLGIGETETMNTVYRYDSLPHDHRHNIGASKSRCLRPELPCCRYYSEPRDWLARRETPLVAY